MASFYVLFNVQEGTAGGWPGGKREYTKAEAEKLTSEKRFSAGTIKVLGPIQVAKMVEIDCASAAEAAAFARQVLHLPVTGVKAVAESPLTDVEAGEKPTKTVAAASLVNSVAE